MRSSLAHITPSERTETDTAAARFRAVRAWQDHGVLAVRVSDERLTDYERQIVRTIAARLFGERRV